MLLLEFGEREPKSQQHKTDREHHVYHPTTKQMSHDMTSCYSLWTRQDITCILYQIPVGSFHGMEKNIENILSRRLMPTIFSCFPQMPISFRPLSPECEYRSRKTWNLLQFRTVWFVFRYIILTKRYSYSYVQVMRCSSAPRQHVVIIITKIWVHIYLRAIVAGSYSGHTICQSYVEHAPA